MIQLAHAYWSEVGRITAASGIETAKGRKQAAEAALKTAVDLIMMAEDWAVVEAVIKAQALNVWAEVDYFVRAFDDRGAAWADQLAASIVKHAGAAA